MAAGLAFGETKVYAHFMGCWPPFDCGGADEPVKKFLKEGDTAEGLGYLGGRFVNFPLVPQRWNAELIDKAKLDIKRAIRAGIDGFAFDAWAGDNSPQTLDTYFKAAEEMGVDFGLTICFDPSCHGAKWLGEGNKVWEKYVESAKWVLRHKDSPNLARFKGKPLFFGYYSGNLAEKNWKKVSPEEFRANAKECWDLWRKALPCEVFLHGSLENYFTKRAWNQELTDGDLRAIAKDCAATYDAVGAFTGGGWCERGPFREYAKAAGLEWCQPVIPQYSNKAGAIVTEPGLNLLRRRWEEAIAQKCKLLQLVTWNDYGEETVFAPGYGVNYTVMRVNRHYADWLKSGKEPLPEKDEVHAVFRKFMNGALSFPCYTRRGYSDNVLEVVAFLAKPGKVTVEGYGEWDAPAGMSWRQFEARPGKVRASVKRRNWHFAWKEVCRMEAAEEISARPWREDNTMTAWGSTFEEEWEKDFPGVEPLRYAENADADGDGLPNWFEMVYFGKYPYLDTATCAKAGEDPDGDGATNLEEYLRGTNPLKRDEPYAAGHVWRIADLPREGVAGNPARDGRGNYTWVAEYCFGAKGYRWEPGAAMKEIKSGANLRGRMYRIYEKNTLGGNGFDTGVEYPKGTNAVAVVRAGSDTPISLGWISPVDGVVEVSTRVVPKRADVGRVRTTLERGGVVLGRGDARGVAEARGVRVRRGERVRLVVETPEQWRGDMHVVEKFEVRLAGVE